jgi:transglycosylase-like protein/putative peptidoglycan binding protein
VKHSVTASSHTDRALRDRCDSSLMRSRTRREDARRARRRRLRLRGSGASVAVVALAIAIAGAGAAVGKQVAGGHAESGLLTRGSGGPAVSAVQRALGVPADGVFGKRTEANVRLFQARHHLLVDGMVGPQTRAALGLGGSSASTGPASATTPSAASQTAPRRQSAPTRGSASPGGLQRIAQCESGGNPRAVGGGGQYRGKYQFSRATWRSVGGSGDPAAASESEQDRRAAMLYQRSGRSSWPACG